MKKWEILNDKAVKTNEEIVDILLKNRGLKNKKEIENFLSADISKVIPDNLGIEKTEINKSIKRIKNAIIQKEQMIVFGDYDVDGITASAIIWETITKVGGNIMPYIPNRINEGYGLSIAGIDNALLKYPEIKLIITVDNGIVANKAVDYANSKGIDVVVTDHHVASDLKPNAFAIIHSTKVCGASVAYVFSKLIEKEMTGKINIEKHLDLVAIATVADVMELKEYNRILLINGLTRLQKTRRIGLQKLFEISRIVPDKIGVYEIGHIIAPRLNATGRLGDATDSLRLICTKDEKRASELAKTLNEINLLRQTSTFDSYEKARVKVDKKLNLIISYSEDYEPGIIGLISGKLTEEFYKPSIVLSVGKDKSKASARSIHGFNIIEFIRLHSEYLLDAGGHPMAAGFTIETSRLVEFEKKLLSNVKKILNEDILIRKLKIDLELPVEMVSLKLFKAIQKLSPFGYGNPEPIFLSKNLMIENLRRVGKEGNHLKIVLGNEKVKISGILFGYLEEMNLSVGKNVDVVYSLSLNEWNGSESVEFKIKDIKLN